MGEDTSNLFWATLIKNTPGSEPVIQMIKNTKSMYSRKVHDKIQWDEQLDLWKKAVKKQIPHTCLKHIKQ